MIAIINEFTKEEKGKILISIKTIFTIELIIIPKIPPIRVDNNKEIFCR